MSGLKDDDRQHVLFLDPKGLSRFGRRERKKVQLHHEISEIEKQVRENDSDLYLRAYILSVTPARQIDDGGRSVSEWKADGVYFLNETDCLQQVITTCTRWRCGDIILLDFHTRQLQPAFAGFLCLSKILETGLEPIESPPPLPPIEQDEIELLCWMGIEPEG